MIEAFFLGPSKKQIFASYHPPIGGLGQVLTVICPPLFSEYMRTHPALRDLANSLAESGQHVLRFDYRGTGDSFGDVSEVVVSDWLDDIALAVREGCAISGSSLVRVLGVRAGALLASRSMGASDEVQRLVLWDPVPNGSDYIEGLSRMRAAILEGNIYLSHRERSESVNGFAGYRLSGRMMEEIRSLDERAYSDVPKSKMNVIYTSPQSVFPVPGVPQEVVRFACDWDRDSQDLMMPKPVLERILECLTMT